MSSQVETRRVAVLSTAHMTQNDAVFLEHNNVPGLYFRNNYAFQFNDSIELDTDTLSAELRYLLKCLFAKGFSRVEFDQDAEVLDGFPTFEW